MNTDTTHAIDCETRLPRRGPGRLAAGFAAAIARRLEAWRRRRADRAQLAGLSERLRRDIGLADSSPIPAELLERFHRARQTPPREHELRLKPWID